MTKKDSGTSPARMTVCALAEEGDVEARLEALELAAAQAIERRVREVEGLGHGGPLPRTS